MPKLLVPLIVIAFTLTPAYAGTPVKYKQVEREFLKILITKEMRDCLSNLDCPMRDDVLSAMVYNDTLVHEMRQTSLVISGMIRDRMEKRNEHAAAEPDRSSDQDHPVPNCLRSNRSSNPGSHARELCN